MPSLAFEEAEDILGPAPAAVGHVRRVSDGSSSRDGTAGEAANNLTAWTGIAWDINAELALGSEALFKQVDVPPDTKDEQVDVPPDTKGATLDARSVKVRPGSLRHRLDLWSEDRAGAGRQQLPRAAEAVELDDLRRPAPDGAPSLTMVPPPTLLERAIGARITLGSIGTGAQAIEAWERNAAVEAALEEEAMEVS